MNDDYDQDGQQTVRDYKTLVEKLDDGLLGLDRLPRHKAIAMMFAICHYALQDGVPCDQLIKMFKVTATAEYTWADIEKEFDQ